MLARSRQKRKAGSEKGGKGKKAKKENKIKKPLGSYMLFANAKRDEVKADYPGEKRGGPGGGAGGGAGGTEWKLTPRSLFVSPSGRRPSPRPELR